MRSHRRLTQWLVTAALLCASACASAPDNPEVSGSAPVNAEDTAASRATPQAGTPKAAGDGGREDASTDKPTIVLIQRDGASTVFKALEPQIRQVEAAYQDRADFKFLNAESEDPYSQISGHPRLEDIKAFYSKYKSASGTAAIFGKSGDPMYITATANTDPAEYKKEFENKLSSLLRGRSQPAPTPQTLGDLARRVILLEGRAATLEKASEKKSWVDGWAGAFVFGGLALISVLALIMAGGLSLVLMRSILPELKRDLKENKEQAEENRQAALKWRNELNQALVDLTGRVDKVDNTSRGGTGNAAILGQLQQQLSGQSQTLEQQRQKLDQQAQTLGQVAEQLRVLDERLAQIDLQAKQTLVQTAAWLGRLHTLAVGADGETADEAERAAVAARLEADATRLRALAERVEPLTTAMAHLAQSPSVVVSPDLRARVQKLYEDIRRFEAAEEGLAERLQSLRNGSYDERRARFTAAKGELQQRVGISSAEFIKEYRGLFEEHFPQGPKGQAAAEPVGADEIGLLLSGGPDYLMDWFSSYSQLMSQAQSAGASAPQITREVTEELARVYAVAREVLRGFDISPVEIQPGQTAFDHHLYEAAMFRATAEYPANTVIEVQRAGFRRSSTGEVLRRPQVIVSGAASAV